MKIKYAPKSVEDSDWSPLFKLAVDDFETVDYYYELFILESTEEEQKKIYEELKKEIENIERRHFNDRIAEGEQRFGVTLDQEAVNQLVGLMNKLEKMGLDSSYLISQAEKLYNKYGSEIVNYADEAISEAVSEAAARAKEGLWESMKSAFRGFLNKLFG